MALVLAGVAGCASNEVRVRTAIAPDANLNSEKTFRFLPMTMTHPVSDVAQQADPMFENSISGREVRDDIARKMEERGYTRVRDPQADLTVAYYIRVEEQAPGDRLQLWVSILGLARLAVGRRVGFMA